MLNVVKARAHTNIALIKYWGKKDPNLFIPMNSSLSLTLDEFYTDTSVKWLSNTDCDVFYLNGEKQEKEETKKISAFLDLFREKSHHFSPIEVTSTNFVPTAAGLASSASAFAALGAAMNRLTGLDLSEEELSTYIRQGSGSATRSVFGGFVQWTQGNSHKTSRAKFIDDASWDIGMLTLVVNSNSKKISSRQGMAHTVETSQFYPAWVEAANQDLIAIKQAISERNFQKLGEITEANGMKMHGTMLGANPPFCYFEPGSILAMNAVRTLREKGYACYFTMDAGPNVKVLCRNSQMKDLQAQFQALLPDLTIISSGVGQGIQILESH